MKISAALLAVVLVFLIASSQTALAGEVSISVAASLRNALNELIAGYAAENPGVRFTMNCGASGAMAKQIENGAPADLFIPASSEWMDYLLEKGMIDPVSIAAFAHNTLVFVAPRGIKASELRDLLSLGKIAIGSPTSVPAGDYAMRTLLKAGLEKALEGKLVMARDVRECLTYAERGEVDGAFVYRTDALTSRSVSILFTVPRDLYPRVTYPMGLTTSGAGNVDARSFHDYLKGAAAKAILLEHGFEIE